MLLPSRAEPTMIVAFPFAIVKSSLLIIYLIIISDFLRKNKRFCKKSFFVLKSAGLAARTMVWCLAWKGVKTVNTLENLYYGNIDPHEHTVSNGTDKGGSFVTIVRLETKLRATLTEQQKTLLEQFEKADAEISDRHELQAFTIGFRLAARLMMDVYKPTPELEP